MPSSIQHAFLLHIVFVPFSCIVETKKSSCNLALLSEVFKYTTDLIDKAIHTIGDRPGPKDCAEIMQEGTTKSGIYRIWPLDWKTAGSLQVYCDMDTDGGGWTVIQRRGQYGNPEDYFFKDWSDYKLGFGSLEKEFWLGNDIIFVLTNQCNCSLRIDMKDKENDNRYATLTEFWIENEDRLYKIHISGYSENAGDSVTNMDKVPFSTRDRDNDIYSGNCAEHYKGGWWYDACHYANLNGLNLNGENQRIAQGINYISWKGNRYSIAEVEMKIRPNSYAGKSFL